MNLPSTFIDTIARITRGSEVQTGAFLDGANGGSCQPGVGIATANGALPDPSDGNWTLLDQHGVARTPQDSQSIGGVGLNDGNTTAGGWSEEGTLSLMINDASGDGSTTVDGLPHLVSLAAGWSSV